ncbi:hypothetical protein BJ878DRAFT_544327 [Calycina marina]|uniref:Pyridoxamine 5'-phosphate oxidase putative domain-containing protein n=1 Tax=Calycina marina TaxID=1763456 RepID=A0A9P7Z024_9HELO|nr:hypothetical protein BJ878DRAFT_544327 [Calycina marina]
MSATGAGTAVDLLALTTKQHLLQPGIMGLSSSKYSPIIPNSLIEWILEQKVIWIASAPLAADGHVNVPPKGGRYFGIVDEKTFWYQDLTGSGVETISHLLEPPNGCITVLVNAFEGPPRILQGLPDHTERPLLEKSRGGQAGKKKDGIEKYWAHKNSESIDGLPGMRRGIETGKPEGVTPIKKIVGAAALPVSRKLANNLVSTSPLLLVLLSFLSGTVVVILLAVIARADLQGSYEGNQRWPTTTKKMLRGD